VKRLQGLHLTPRQAYWTIAIALAIALLALLLYLLWLLSPHAFVTRGGGAQSGLEPVLVLDGPGTGSQPTFSRPLGAAFGPDGRIYVSDTGNNRIVAFSASGRYLFEFGGLGVVKPAPGVDPTWAEGRLNFPAGIDVDENGDVYVADFRNDQIQVFDAQGTFLRRFPDPAAVVGKGSSGQEGTGIAVTDVAVHKGKVYATDSYQVVVFSDRGALLNQFGRPGSGPGQLDRPNGIEVGPNGTIYVSDSNNNRIVAFGPDGGMLWTSGEPIDQIEGRIDYTFALPRGIAYGEDLGLLVVDAFEFSIVQLTTGGTVVAHYGQRGTEPAQLNFPNGIDVRGTRMLVADKENNRVQLLELVEK
jgi:DNA-binding beta-propeller fold protein YncE